VSTIYGTISNNKNIEHVPRLKMPPKRGARGGRGARGAATAASRKPPTGQSSKARICGCHEVGNKFGADEKHNLSKHEPTGVSLASAFIIIKTPDSLQSQVQQRGLQLTTSKAVFNKEEARKLNEEAARRQTEKVQQLKEEQARQEKEEKFAKDARKKARCFLSFKYGKSVEDRKAVGEAWTAKQLIERARVPQTLEGAEQPTSVTDTTTATTASPPTNEPSSEQRITRQSINLRKAVSGVHPNHPSPDQPDFSPLTPGFAHGPAQPLTTNDSAIFVSQRQSLHLPPEEDSEDPEDMSNRPVYPESGGAAEAIKDVIQDLFALQQHVHQFKPEQQDGLNRQVEHVAKSLSTLDEIVKKPNNPLHNLKVAPEIIEYVDDARNPDIFSREFVELVQRGNSVMNGKQQAFRSFSQIYAKKLKDAFDGMDEEVDLIMDNAGMEEKDGKFVDKAQNGNAK